MYQDKKCSLLVITVLDHFHTLYPKRPWKLTALFNRGSISYNTHFLPLACFCPTPKSWENVHASLRFSGLGFPTFQQGFAVAYLCIFPCLTMHNMQAMRCGRHRIEACYKERQRTQGVSESDTRNVVQWHGTHSNRSIVSRQHLQYDLEYRQQHAETQHIEQAK